MKNPFSLEGRTVLIAGAAGGIGAATAQACASLGARLLLVDVKPMAALAAELEAEAAEIDITRRAEVDALAERFPAVDAVVAAAGICPFDDWVEAADWDAIFHRVMDVNVLGPLNLARAWLPRMAARGDGRIVLVGSIGGRNGGTSPIVQPHYIASKGGVHALVWWLARRAAPQGVLVNGIAPGPVATAMTATTPYDREAFPLRRLAEPEEIAWPTAFLCSAAASYISGTVLDVNGGLYVG
jgi:3-oxoacyl-[acyl-carrier protein] reductase